MLDEIKQKAETENFWCVQNGEYLGFYFRRPNVARVPYPAMIHGGTCWMEQGRLFVKSRSRFDECQEVKSTVEVVGFFDEKYPRREFIDNSANMTFGPENSIAVLEEVKSKLESRNYRYVQDKGEIKFLIKNGRLNVKGEPKYMYIGDVLIKGGKLLMRIILIPFPYYIEMENPDAVITFLLERYPNLAPGEVLPEFEE